MAENLSLNEEALIQRCQEKNIPHEGKSVTELRILLIQSCTEKAPGAAEESVPWEVQLRKEQMALEREKMEAREAKEKRELVRATMDHEREKARMELEKAKLYAEVKIPRQQWRSEMACPEKTHEAAEVDLPLGAELRREQMALEREKMEAREAKEKRELEHARMEHEREKARMELEKAKLEAEVKIQQQKQWRSETASLQCSQVAPEGFKAFAPRDDPHTSLNTSEKAGGNWGVKGADFMRSTEPTQTTAMADTNLKESIKKDLSKMKVSVGQRSLQNVLANEDKELKLLENARLDIAFTGISGVGKSSLVNAFLNIEESKEDRAKTGVIQCTMDPERYTHPKFPKLTLWDLPGIGTQQFQAEEYLKKVNFSRYDFFIIVTAERFTVDDAMLASEIQKMNKQFYFVRTKMDQAMDAERRKPDFNEELTIEKIRKYCLSNLIKEGAVNPRVFLISSWHLNMYEFPLLQRTLANELNDLKRPLLILAMPALSKAFLQEKKAAMEAVIWKKTLMSCRTPLFPLFGLSLNFDIGLLVTTLKDFCKAFCLDEDSLQSLAKRVNKPFEELRFAVKKTPKANQINPKYVQSLISSSQLVGSAMVLEELSELKPFIDSLSHRSDSFATIFYMLKRFLEDAMEDAKNVLAIVVE